MAYYPLYSPLYPSYYAPSAPMNVNTQAQGNAQQNANNGLVWVQGIEAAKAQFVPAGQTVLLMDSEGERFYLKSSDASGMPMPLRVFRYEEVTAQTTQKPEYVTRAEFEQLRQDVSALTDRKAVALTDE